ncbi:MAG: AAA family ATPase [Pseudomonadales bacterium]|nr:AAA family ATPase [Candidatus Woesebacteria bacterium]MCB9801254.1 AAA family ATPase [Pseudomonadales bacterium]
MSIPKLDAALLPVLERLESAKNHIFLTGYAGTGKSTLLDFFRQKTKKKVAFLAPTGVAALTIHGQTIHSFFGFRPDVTVDKVKRFYRKKDKKGLFKKLDVVVIDEISMVRADLLDCIDEMLRLHGRDVNEPFGGVRMVFIGDLHQLPPVVKKEEEGIFKTVYKSPYFFSAHVFDQLRFEFIELEKIYRQSDESFIEILQAIRNNQLEERHVERLNARFDPQFETPSNKFFIHLTTTNRKAQMINDYHLNRLFSERFTYESESSGTLSGRVSPAPQKLEVKVGAQVMMVANDRDGRWVNGSLGKVDGVKAVGAGEDDVLLVELDTGEEVEVTPYTWEMFKIEYNPASDRLQTEVTGTYRQYPLTLAWAITIHKSQGKTFDHVIIDFDRGTFAHGQAYVALSRARSLEGIVLTTPFQAEFVLSDTTIHSFLSKFKYISEAEVDDTETLEAIGQLVSQAQSEGLLVTFLDKDAFRHVVEPLKYSVETGKLSVSSYTSGTQEVFDVLTLSEFRVLTDIS